MPSRPQISREQILRTALEMLMEEGYESIRITAVAERLGCSTQPISWQFGGMEGFRAALAAEAVAYATERVRPTAADPLAAFYGIGTGYIDLAYDCPRLLASSRRRPTAARTAASSCTSSIWKASAKTRARLPRRWKFPWRRRGRGWRTASSARTESSRC